jgi:hypothetical protein
MLCKLFAELQVGQRALYVKKCRINISTQGRSFKKVAILQKVPTTITNVQIRIKNHHSKGRIAKGTRISGGSKPHPVFPLYLNLYSEGRHLNIMYCA